MALGMLDRTPPPFFRQGPSALTRLMFFSALALFLMVADTRFQLTQPLRAAMATVLHPVERVLRVPVDAWQGGAEYFLGLEHALAEEAKARQELSAQAARSARADQLAQENLRLRALLELRPALKVRSQAAEILYDAPDPYSRKVIIDRGARHGIALASPVINEAGVLGQVTRVFPYSAEVTLLTDKEAAIPVGDELSTSGVDGVYPAGVPVAKVTHIDRRVDSGFARISLAPLASPDSVRHVLVLEPVGLQMPPKPEPEPAKPAVAPKKGGRK